MSRLVLHIGPHKTGTTSIQRFMDSNRAALLGMGVLYPTGRHHGQLGSVFSIHPEGNVFNKEVGRSVASDIKDGDIRYWDAMQRELVEFRYETCVLSYEGFVGLVPRELASMAQAFSRYFSSIQVVAYYRDPYAFAISEVSQRARMGHPPGIPDDGVLLDEVACAGGLPIFPYRDIFPRFEAQFGLSNFLLRQYRDDESGWDVRQDFIQVLGVEPCGLTFEASRANARLSAEGVELAIALREGCAQGVSSCDFQNKYDAIVSGLKGAPIRLSESQLKLIERAVAPHLDYLAQHFHVNADFPRPEGVNRQGNPGKV